MSFFATDEILSLRICYNSLRSIWRCLKEFEVGQASESGGDERSDSVSQLN